MRSTEDAVLRRFAQERKSRGIAYRQLSKMMSEAGTPIAASSLQKMLSDAQPQGEQKTAQPKRPLSVDEFLVLCQVLSLSPAQLLGVGTPESAQQEEQWGILSQDALAKTDRDLRGALKDLRGSVEQVQEVWQGIAERREQISAARRETPLGSESEYLAMDQAALKRLQASVATRLKQLDHELASRPAQTWTADE